MSQQLKNIGFLMISQILIKSSSFSKQLILAFFLGVSGRVDLLIIAQIIPNIIGSVIAGGAGELLVAHTDIERNEKKEFISLFTVSISLITLIFLLTYLFFLPIISDFLDVSIIDKMLFYKITLLMILSKFMSSIISTLQYLMYAKELYKRSVISSLFAELFGVSAILLTIKNSDILSFGIGIFVTSLTNALFFIFFLKLPIFSFIKPKKWRTNLFEIWQLIKKVLILGIQTFINHLSSLVERSVSFRFLTPGYLSALNYSKSITELPQTVFLSSVLTNTYIEQNKLKKKNKLNYQNYTFIVNGLLTNLSFYFQFLSLAFGPLVVMLFFNRGAFEKEDLSLTFTIYQVLLIGFIPGIMTHFLTRIMFIEEQNKSLFWILTFKSTFEILLMFFLIKDIEHIIPFSLTLSKYITIVLLYLFLMRKNPKLFNLKKTTIVLLIALCISIPITLFNKNLFYSLVQMSNYELTLAYLPITFLIVIISIFYLKHMFKKLKVSYE